VAQRLGARRRTGDAVARPQVRWKPLISAVGTVTATGAAVASPDGVRVTSAVGAVTAQGQRNPTDAEWLVFFLEAA